MGGKNDFLGISWMVGGALCFVLGLALLVVNTIKPRELVMLTCLVGIESNSPEMKENHRLQTLRKIKQ